MQIKHWVDGPWCNKKFKGVIPFYVLMHYYYFLIGNSVLKPSSYPPPHPIFEDLWTSQELKILIRLNKSVTSRDEFFFRCTALFRELGLRGDNFRRLQHLRRREIVQHCALLSWIADRCGTEKNEFI